MNGEKFQFRSGIAKQKLDLTKRFPKFETEINLYWTAVEEESTRFANYIKRQLASAYLPSWLIPVDSTFGQETVNQALSRLKITDKTLCEVLTYLHGDYGASPETASWAEHCKSIDRDDM